MTDARTDLPGSVGDGYAPPGEYRPIGGSTVLAGVGRVLAPRVTRLLTTMWTGHAVADAARLTSSAAGDR